MEKAKKAKMKTSFLNRVIVVSDETMMERLLEVLWLRLEIEPILGSCLALSNI
jgi:hypothetical protein